MRRRISSQRRNVFNSVAWGRRGGKGDKVEGGGIEGKEEEDDGRREH